MSVLKVARLGHPVLRKVAEPLTGAEIQSREIQELINHMIETMHEYEGVGLAAKAEQVVLAQPHPRADVIEQSGWGQ